MEKHTPGPWYVKAQAMNHVGIFKNDGDQRIKIAQACSSGEDAKLMAAAPELLEALKQIAEWAGPPNGSEFGTLNKIALIASKAIANATGVQS